jgi:hypothetical protein
MAVNEYRRHAAECLCIADDIVDPQKKMLLIAMAQAWLRLAQQAEAGFTVRSECMGLRNRTSGLP